MIAPPRKETYDCREDSTRISWSAASASTSARFGRELESTKKLEIDMFKTSVRDKVRRAEPRSDIWKKIHDCNEPQLKSILVPSPLMTILDMAWHGTGEYKGI